jgi:hypothetical protein
LRTQEKTYRLLQDVLVGQKKLTVWKLDVAAEAKSRELAYCLGAVGGG